jgi:hypothetical protein
MNAVEDLRRLLAARSAIDEMATPQEDTLNSHSPFGST